MCTNLYYCECELKFWKQDDYMVANHCVHVVQAVLVAQVQQEELGALVEQVLQEGQVQLV